MLDQLTRALTRTARFLRDPYTVPYFLTRESQESARKAVILVTFILFASIFALQAVVFGLYSQIEIPSWIPAAGITVLVVEFLVYTILLSFVLSRWHRHRHTVAPIDLYELLRDFYPEIKREGLIDGNELTEQAVENLVDRIIDIQRDHVLQMRREFNEYDDMTFTTITFRQMGMWRKCGTILVWMLATAFFGYGVALFLGMVPPNPLPPGSNPVAMNIMSGEADRVFGAIAVVGSMLLVTLERSLFRLKIGSKRADAAEQLLKEI